MFTRIVPNLVAFGFGLALGHAGMVARVLPLETWFTFVFVAVVSTAAVEVMFGGRAR